MDAGLLEEVRSHVGPRGVSAFVAIALRHELDRVRLRELLDDLATELGPPDEEMTAEQVRGLVGGADDAGRRRAGRRTRGGRAESEALSAIAFPGSARSARRAHAVLTAIGGWAGGPAHRPR